MHSIWGRLDIVKHRLLVLQSQDLRVGQEKKPYIGFTQENSIENSVQNCLPYILKPHGPCYYYFSLL